jgi:chromosomal replication initiation ATPase DnaA
MPTESGRHPEYRYGSARGIIAETAERFGLLPQQITGCQRSRRLSAARRVIARYLYERGYSLREIGIELGGRHHSTILALLRTDRRQA